MSLDSIGAGNKAPDEINVVIEIPARGTPVKYEIDKKSGLSFVDRFLNTPMYYPCDYGFVPSTIHDDGDPIDVLVITPTPLITGAVIIARPIGVLNMEDEAGLDEKILAVPISKLTKAYETITDYHDVSPDLLAAISHFFEHYKDLEPNKWVKVTGWGDVNLAKQKIVASIERYTDSE